MKNVIWVLVSSLVVIFSACQSKQEDEVVSLDEISESSEAYAEKNNFPLQNDIAINYYDSISSFSQSLIDSLMYNPTSIGLLDTALFPDRFGASFSEKWYAKSKADSLVFMRWTFQSDVKAENALYNWLDCFGIKCRAIPLGMKTNFTKQGTMILCNQKELMFIETSKTIKADVWLQIIKGNNKNKEWKYFFYQQPNKKIEWKTINPDGEWKDLNQQED